MIALGFLLCVLAGGYASSIAAAWFFGDTAAAALIAGHVTMKLGTALSIWAQSITTMFILATTRRNEHAGAIMGMAFLSVGVQAAAAAGLLAAGDPAAIDTVAPGVPSVGTWLCVGLLAYIDLLYCLGRWRQRTAWIAGVLLTAAGLALVGHWQGIPALYWRFPWSTGMAIPTALCVSALALAHICRLRRP